MCCIMAASKPNTVGGTGDGGGLKGGRGGRGGTHCDCRELGSRISVTHLLAKSATTD